MESVHMCSICFDEFNEPKILPCFHTFCLDCLGGHATRVLKDGKFNCPVCRAVIDMPRNGVKGFQTNFYISEMKATKVAEEEGKEDTGAKLSEADLESGQCPQHQNEKLSLFCEQCKIPCCRDCKIDSHDGHNSIRLVDMSKKLINEAGEVLALIQQKTERTHAQEINLTAKMDAVVESKLKETTNIVTRKTCIDDKVKQHTEAATQSLNTLTEAASNDITNAIRRVKSSRDTLGEIAAFLRGTIESKDPLQLLKAIPEAREKADNVNTKVNIERIFPGILVKTSVDSFDLTVKRVIGNVMMKKYSPALRGELAIVADINTEVNGKTSFVKAILPVSDEEAWVAFRSKGNKNGTLLKKVNIQGHIAHAFRLDGMVNSMAKFSDDKVVVSMLAENKICVIEDDRNVFELVGIRNPMGLAYFDNELYVCSLESRDIKDVQPYKTNRILVFSDEGIIKRTIEFYDGVSLFSFPGKISVCYDGDIVVSDFGTNEIIRLAPNGKPKNRYKGGDEFLCGNAFFDDTGNVIVETSEGIHVLDECLNLVHRFTTNFTVANTSAMAVGTCRLIWLADKENVISVWKY